MVPSSERRPRQGLILKSSSRTEKECFDRLLFGADVLARDEVLALAPGDRLFLLNVDKDELSGPYLADSHGTENLVPEAWNRTYPFQVRIRPVATVARVKEARYVLDSLGIQAHQLLMEFEADHLEGLLVSLGNRGLLIDASEALARIVKKHQREVRLRRKELGLKPEGEQKPPLASTTLWDYPKQSYGSTPKGNNRYAGVTPAFIIWNLIKRYTLPGDLVLDPMCGSGTTIDVCREEGRRAIGLDIVSVRPDIGQNDARRLPLEDNSIDLVFIDSPYGDNIKYNDDSRSIGNIPADSEEFYQELEKVMREAYRVLKPGKVLGWLIGDQWVRRKFTPVGFKVYDRLTKYFTPVDVICVVRRSQTSNTGMWHNRALRHNFYLRGFKYLHVMKKPDDTENDSEKSGSTRVAWTQYERGNRTQSRGRR